MRVPLPNQFGRCRSVAPFRCLLAGVLGLVFASSAAAIDYDAAFDLYQSGKYEEALEASKTATDNSDIDLRWWRLRVECLTTLGRNKEGAEVLKNGLKRYVDYGGLRIAGYALYRQYGKPDEGKKLLRDLLKTANSMPWRFQSASDYVWLGQAAARMDVDAREVLERFYDEALKLDPELRDVYVATGELALDKHDHKIAAETFRTALEKFPDDPDLLCGLAAAVGEESDDDARDLLKQALARNPRHIPSLLAVAEEALAHEAFDDARAALDRVHAVYAEHARAWALRAVLAHLQADEKEEAECRKRALATWKKNPDVDHVIGAKLSAAYRFAEGAEHQREALKLDNTYLPARTQLAQDLLRLGENDEGWALVDEVQQADEYNVVAYNLATLHERIQHYTVLESEHFRVSMDRREAAVYGQAVVDLLERACQTLGDKYGWQPTERVAVEILTRQQDFAVRTFGLPGGDGILGVCFGRVITVNSPAALQGNPSNWHATLWHEYCHVVTLELTKHRIPRWLSEGISVYEERQADPTWGNRLNPSVRRMILDGEMASVSELSQAFRQSRSAEHFNLAYYESSLVVEYLVDNYGIETLRGILDDLAKGVPVNISLSQRTSSLGEFETDFDNFAREQALNYGPKVDWNAELAKEIPADDLEALEAWVKEHPKHYLGRLRLAQALIKAEDTKRAITLLRALIKDVPDWSGDDSPYALLAKVYRDQKNVAKERQTLEDLASRSDDALVTYRRLLELAASERDEQAIATNYRRYLQVQPLDESPHRQAAESGLRGGDVELAVSAARVLVAFEPADRAGARYLLARLLHAQGQPEAKRQVLLALEERPRYRDAQRLLLDIVGEKEKE